MSLAPRQRWLAGISVGVVVMLLVLASRLFRVDAGPPLAVADAPTPQAAPTRAPRVEPSADVAVPTPRAPPDVVPPPDPAPTTTEAAEPLDRQATAAAVRDVFKRYAGQLQYCYESVLSSIPDASGHANVVLQIEDGVAIDVLVDDHTTADQMFTDCLSDKVADWNFEGVPDGSVTWPVRFKSLSRDGDAR